MKLVTIVIGTSLATIIFLAPARAQKTKEQSPLPTTPAPAQALYEQALSYSKSKDWLNAKQTYQKILNEYPDYPDRQLLEGKLQDTNIRIIHSNLITPQSMLYTVAQGDTLDKLARRFVTAVSLIKSSNALKNNTLKPGQTLRIWIKPFTIIIDKTKNILTLKTDEEIIKIYPIATGADNITPAGEFNISSKLKNPVWFHKGEAIPPEDPRNALGTRWLGLDKPQYGIHGTIQPELIGQQVSHGCIRMHNKDVEELYEIVPLGIKVVILE